MSKLNQRIATTTEPLNSVSDAVANAETRQIAREEREYQLETADREAIDKIILSADVQKGGKIRLERKGPLDQIYQYICYIPADQWDTEQSYEYIKKMYGGGDYKCMTFRANGQMYKPFTFSIDHRAKGKLDEDEIRRIAEESKSQKNGGSSSEMMKMWDVMRESQSGGIKTTDIISLMDKANSKSSEMNMMMMTMMMKSMEQSQQSFQQMMTFIMPFMLKDKPANDNTALVTKLIELNANKTPLSETLAMMSQIKEIFGNNNNEEKEPEDMWSRLTKMAPALIGAFTGQTPAPTVSVAPAATSTSTEQPKQVSTAPPLGGLFAVMPPQYQQMLMMTLNAAEQGKDVGLYADLILDQADDQGLAIIRKTLTGDDWCSKLFGDERVVAHIKPWLEELRKILIEPDATSSNIGPNANSPANTPTGQPA